MTKIKGHLGKVLEEKATERFSFDKEDNCTHEVKCGNTWMSLEQIGRRMAELRKIAGLTTEGLALRAGVNKSTVNQMEKGKQNVSLDTLIRISGVIQAEIVIQSRAGE